MPKIFGMTLLAVLALTILGLAYWLSGGTIFTLAP